MWLGGYREEGRNQASSQPETSFIARKSCFNSKSDFAALFVPPSAKNGRIVSLSASLNTSMPVPEQASRRHSKICECRSTKLKSAHDETLHPFPVLNCSV